ncbi:MAG: murein biosynthesis integral membrane protein MurJ [Burkholderiaceae bacterium]|nr:murein biosynthesis integral membrane protein MurJ [Burkholderiaceae bacterium]
MNLLKTAATISGLTLLSRITGLARETLTAAYFGAGSQTDAFFVAFRLPNLLRRLFAEGAFSQAFVPVLGQVKSQNGDAQALRLARHCALIMAAVLALVCLVAIIGAPILVWLMSGGFGGNAETFGLSVMLTRWMFPYILMISLVALASGVLNTWSEFKAPAFAPVLLNLSFIGCAVLISPLLAEPIWALALAVVLGGIAQLTLMAMALKSSLRHPSAETHQQGRESHAGRPDDWSLRTAWRDEYVRRILRLMVPATLAVSVAQVSLIINTHIAARLEAGSVSWLSFADRLMEFPTALLGVALGTVLLPSLTKANSEQDAARVSQLIDWGLRLVALLAIPASIGLAVLAIPLAAALFHYGQFDHQDLTMTAQAMIGYAVGLFGLIAIKVLAPGFYAQQNIKTPVKIALFTLALTQALNILFVPLFAHAGLALATSLAACANALLLYRGLRKRSVYTPAAGWTGFIIKILISSLVMGGVIGSVALELDWSGLGAQPLLRIIWLAVIVLVAGLVYFSCLRILGVRWMQFLKKDAV